jgi:hypothetical protein
MIQQGGYSKLSVTCRRGTERGKGKEDHGCGVRPIQGPQICRPYTRIQKGRGKVLIQAFRKAANLGNFKDNGQTLDNMNRYSLTKEANKL